MLQAHSKTSTGAMLLAGCTVSGDFLPCRIFVFVKTCTHTCTWTHTHAHMHTGMHKCVHTDEHAHMHTHITSQHVTLYIEAFYLDYWLDTHNVWTPVQTPTSIFCFCYIPYQLARRVGQALINGYIYIFTLQAHCWTPIFVSKLSGHLDWWSKFSVRISTTANKSQESLWRT